MDKNQITPPENGLQKLRERIAAHEEKQFQEKIFLGSAFFLLSSALVVVLNVPEFGLWKRDFYDELSRDQVNLLNERNAQPSASVIVEGADFQEITSAAPKVRLYWLLRTNSN